MRYVNVSDEYVASVLTANQLKATQKIDESASVEKVEEAQEHVCPLCESELDGPIAEEALQECVDAILESINEALEAGEGEDLSEAEEDPDSEDEDEEDEKEEV